MFGALKSLGAPTASGNTHGGPGDKEKKEEQEKKKDLSGSAVTRLRQMFERNNSDSKKRASLEARPLSRPIAALAVSSIGEHEVIKETAAAVAPTSVDAAGESAAPDTTAGMQLLAAGTKAAGSAPVVAVEKTTGAGPAATPVPTKEAVSSAAEESYMTVAVAGAEAQDAPSVLAQPALLPMVPKSSMSSSSRSSGSQKRMGEETLAQATSSGEASGAFSSTTSGMSQAPIATVEDVILVSVAARPWNSRRETLGCLNALEA